MSETNFQPANRARFQAAMTGIDRENARDPNLTVWAGASRPRELVYSEWLTAWVLKLAPDASEELRLAARAQHLRRWEIPRHTYPMNRAGYLKWRQTLKNFHAEEAGGILISCGYPEPAVARVRQLIRKELLPEDPETCVLEDALCLVFLEHQLAGLLGRSTEEKVVNALRKSWGKMTPRARALALAQAYPPEQKRLLELALKASGGEAARDQPAP